VMENEKGRQTLGATKLLKSANKAAMKLWWPAPVSTKMNRLNSGVLKTWEIAHACTVVWVVWHKVSPQKSKGLSFLTTSS
jgi:hypothetical protein